MYAVSLSRLFININSYELCIFRDSDRFKSSCDDIASFHNVFYMHPIQSSQIIRHPVIDDKFEGRNEDKL